MARYLILIYLLYGCSSEDSSSPQSPTFKSGYFAVTGSYSSSYNLTFLELAKRDISPLPESFTALEEEVKNADRVADLIIQERVESIFTTGDNNYKAGCSSTIDLNIGRLYHSYIGNYQGEYGEGATNNRFFPSLGNHDVLVYEAYLVKNDLAITMGNYGSDGVTTYRFSKENWVNAIEESLASSKDAATALIQGLIDQKKLESKSVSLEDNSTGTAYLPTQVITLSDFSQDEQTAIQKYHGQWCFLEVASLEIASPMLSPTGSFTSGSIHTAFWKRISVRSCPI